MKHWPFAVAALMLGTAWAFIGSLSRPEQVLERTPFASFPLDLEGGWKGRDLDMDPKVLDILRLTDYLMRVYVPTPGRARSAGVDSSEPASAPNGPVWLYIGYYQSQRTGSSYHSPKNCLPGAGWQIGASETVGVSLPGPGQVSINRVLIEKGLDRQLVVYWYHDRGRVIASEYEAKAMLIWDSMTRHRTDGALVRITTPVDADPEAAWTRALSFLLETWPLLVRYMPA